jgi:prophage DNA circulation protein
MTMQSAVADLCQRAALAALASATIAYQPSSYDDAVAVRTRVCGLLSVAAIRAADVGDTGTFLALRSLNAAVAADLTARGAVLPQLVTVTRARPMPSLKLAYDLYGDASRADDLTARVDPQNPAFFPTMFKVLAA